MTEAVYSSIDELDQQTRSLLENYLSEDERLIMGIRCARRHWWRWNIFQWYWRGWNPLHREATSRKLILTNQRIIDLKHGRFSTQFMGFNLAEMNPPICEFHLRGNYLTLEGSDIVRRYRVKGDVGREFSFAVRNQLNQRYQPSEDSWRDKLGLG